MSDWWLGQLARQDQYGDTPPANWPEVYGGLTPDERGLQPQTATIGPAEMRSYTPTLGERLKGGLSDLFRSGGADTYNAGKLGDIAATGLSLLPPVGYSVAKSEMEHGVEGRNPAGIALGALGAIPGAKGVMGELASPFYSAAGRAVENAKLGKGTGEQWLGYLRNQPGVKPEELNYVFGNLPEGQLTKAQMQAHAVENAVTLGEVNKGGRDPKEGLKTFYERMNSGERMPAWEQLTQQERSHWLDEYDKVSPTKYSQWQLPGGENYRETLLTLPGKQSPAQEAVSALDQQLKQKYGQTYYHKLAPEEKMQIDMLRDRANREIREPVSEFRSSHWSEPNVLAHVRTNDREIPGVGKSLHVEEIQSDWHQKGRAEGYRHPSYILQNKNSGNRSQRFDTKEEALAYLDTLPEQMRGNLELRNGEPIGAIPDAPFKSTWADVALKRQIREAAEKGYDAISWTPGEAQAARYDLSKHVDRVTYNPENGRLRAIKDGVVKLDEKAKPEEIERHVGKDVAAKLLQTKQEPYSAVRGADIENVHSLSGLDLKVGGEGMKAFYDKMLVDKANAIGKKHGARVEQSHIETKPEMEHDPSGRLVRKEKHPVHVLRITPELRAAAMKGFPLFTAGGIVAGGTIGELARQDKYGRNE